MGSVNNNLKSNTLIRGVYRSLLNTGRTYAAFEPRHMTLLKNFRDRKEIFDPMSGYGGLMNYCSLPELNLKSYGIEFNLPSYYWQVLNNPWNSSTFKKLCLEVKNESRRWPKPRLSITVSDNWFSEESMRILELLWQMTYRIATKISQKQDQEIALAFLLPFVGRFSTTIQGNIVTSVKKGGLCVYTNWRDDFRQYIKKLEEILFEGDVSKVRRQTVRLGDARYMKLGGKRFSAMLTSPPYPNSIDYYKMFNPENFFIEHLVKQKYISDVTLRDRVIGSSDVSKKDQYVQYSSSDIKSLVARDFLDFIANYKATKQVEYDNRVYYLPLFCNYFYGIEKAYENISKYLSNDFEGFIIVVNNTARKREIPVGSFVVETWQRLGFNAKIFDCKELPHIGGLNPKTKGKYARHMEYIIKVCR